MEKTPTKIVSELGSRLLQLSRPNKDLLVKSLRVICFVADSDEVTTSNLNTKNWVLFLIYSI